MKLPAFNQHEQRKWQFHTVPPNMNWSLLKISTEGIHGGEKTGGTSCVFKQVVVHSLPFGLCNTPCVFLCVCAHMCVLFCG